MKKLRLRFIQLISMAVILIFSSSFQVSGAENVSKVSDADRSVWPVLKKYDSGHLAKIALPVGGIGTGTVSLGGRGDLRDWEIMNRTAKGFIPKRGAVSPFFAVFIKTGDGRTITRALEGPVELSGYEESHGSTVPNHGLPRFRECSFETAYPFGQVLLSDPDVPIDVRLKAFNPLIPTDPDASGIPVAILRYELHNRTDKVLTASICGTMPNFIGMDGSETEGDWRGEPIYVGAKSNRNEYRTGKNVRGIFMTSDGVDKKKEQWGTIALTTPEKGAVTYRTAWLKDVWGNSLLDFWDDFSADGSLEERESTGENMPVMSLATGVDIPPHSARTLTFFLTWHFPNRQSWTPKNNNEDLLTNYYTTKYIDAWDVAESVAVRLPDLEKDTVEFVDVFLASPLPEEVKESALFNISTLRTQTCFRTSDGMFFGWEGSSNHRGCCHGSCTHVWNYEQATAFLFGGLAKTMRETEFGSATDDAGLMSFRVGLPLSSRACDFGKAAADGQMGCIMKMYRDWQLSGDDNMLKRLWPKVRKTLEFCWIPGGWDANSDGVMEGCQHNTMDVEYYGPNPQMELWYLGALRAAEEMANYLGDKTFAKTCREKFTYGSAWTDSHLFNGEYYVHLIQPPGDPSKIAPSLQIGMGASDPNKPDFQLGSGCLVDQLVGQYMAHICGLGYLVDKGHVSTTLNSIMKYNYRKGLTDHFNCLRSFAMGDESVLLMASYPKERPVHPFPYFTEVMTGFEYTAAVGMLYEGMTVDGLLCIRNIRDRYDGLKRSPFDEAECGHHYARAMASWASVLALTGFEWSGVNNTMTFAPFEGTYFWSNGYAYGTVTQVKSEKDTKISVRVIKGSLNLKTVIVNGVGSAALKKIQPLKTGEEISLAMKGR